MPEPPTGGWQTWTTAQALLDGKPLHGIWIDRSKLYEAERRGGG